MRSPSLSASSRSWVMNTMVRCMRACRSMSSSCICVRMSGSSALKASSMSSTSGSLARARARPTRCCMPPESSEGWLCSNPFRPTSSMAFMAFSVRVALSMPLISSPNSTLSSTLRCGSRPKCWKTMDILYRRRLRRASRSSLVMSSPSNRISPAVGSMSRFRQRIMVDLPLPESPMTTKVSRFSMSKLAPLMATVQPVLARISLLDRPCSIRGRARFGLGPKTFDRFLMDINDILLPGYWRSPALYGSAPPGTVPEQATRDRQEQLRKRV